MLRNAPAEIGSTTPDPAPAAPHQRTPTCLVGKISAHDDLPHAAVDPQQPLAGDSTDDPAPDLAGIDLLLDRDGDAPVMGVRAGGEPVAEVVVYSSQLDGALVVQIDTSALGDRVLRVAVNDGLVYSGAVFSAHPDLGDHNAEDLRRYFAEVWTKMKDAGELATSAEYGVTSAPKPAWEQPPQFGLPDPTIAAAVSELDQYLWSDAHADYLDQDPDGRATHILTALSALTRWLDIGNTCPFVTAPPYLRSTLAAGFTPARVEYVLDRIQQVTDLHVVCGWEFCDHSGFGGTPEFYIATTHHLYHLVGELQHWLTLGPAEAPMVPGPARSWIGAPALDVCLTNQGDNRHNFVRHQR